MSNIKLPYFILALVFGVFMIVYGGYDDSPGGQLLGLLVAVIGVAGAVMRIRRKRTSSQQSPQR